MTIAQMCLIPTGTTYKETGPLITRELIAEFATKCGFGDQPHVKGTVSLLSLHFQTEPFACLHGAGTLVLMNNALESVFKFEEPYDLLTSGYDYVSFLKPNIEGGSNIFFFTVTKVQPARWPIARLGIKVPMCKISLKCEITNSLNGWRYDSA